MSLYQTAVKRPVTTILVFVAIAILGLYSLINLSIDLYPKIEMNSIMVVTSYAGAGAEDIENTISRPIENSLNSVPQLKHIQSSSKDNFSTVRLEFNEGTDLEVATNDVRDKLDMITNMLPKEANKPLLFKFSSDDIPVMLIFVTAQESRNGLSKILDDNVANELARIQGVGTVSTNGAPIREINVYVDPQKLEAYNLSVEQIAQAIQANNQNIPIGTIDLGNMTSSIRVEGEFTNTDQMQNIIVANRQGRNVYLRDVANVHDGNKERLQESYLNGAPGGIIIVYKQSGANSVDICNKIRKELPRIEKQLPADIRMEVVMDTSTNITNTINSLVETIIITLLVVIVVVLFFLGRWRATFIIVLTIPVSLVASLIYLYATGNTLNIISMSALSIAIGMVVDDAIVVLENITTHIERGSYPKQAAVFATNEVALSVVASTLTMLAVFLPLTMISGFTGIFFRQLGWVVSVIMIVSTAAALSLTPVLSSKLLRHTQRNSRWFDRLYAPIQRGLDRMDNAYARLLNKALRHRKMVVAGSALIFVLSLFLFPLVKTSFMGDNDSGFLQGSIEFPQGYNKETARAFAQEFSATTLQKYAKDIKQFSFTVGQADEDNAFASFSDNGSNIISFNVNLQDFDHRTHTTSEVADLLRRDLASYPDIDRYNIQAGRGGVGGSLVQMEIYGYDFDKTTSVASQFIEQIQKDPSCSQATMSRKPSTPEYHIVFDEEKLALYGLTKATAATAVRNTVTGTQTAYYREDGEEYRIKVRYAPQYRQSITDIENALIFTPTGTAIRVRDLGKVVQEYAPPTIERKDKQRYINISCVIAPGHEMSELVAASQKVMSELNMPDGVSYKIGGNYETQQESFKSLFSLSLLIIILVFIVMAAEFESLRDPFVIMFSVPFALTGVLVGLVVTGTALGMMSLIGAIILIGVVVKNGIVLIDYTILCRGRGMGILHSIVTAGKSRLRPVLMTTATTVLGMIPLAIGTGEGAEMWRPMGITVAFGLSISTLITLVIVPTVYALFASREVKQQRKALRQRKIRKAKDAERKAFRESLYKKQH